MSMNKSILKFLLPASALAFLASFSAPALRADDPTAATVGALSDTGAPAVTPTAKEADSATGAAKKGKKKGGKKKHGKKKAKAAPATDSSSADAGTAATAPAAAAADAAK
jgi:hypothetical protein